MARARKPFRFLWITDPWNTLDHERDTTLRLAGEALLLGHECYWCDIHGIRWENGAVLVSARRMRATATSLDVATEQPLSHFDSLQYRTDPPVDLGYLQPLQLLLAGSEARRLPLTNPAEVLMTANEKLEAAFLGELMPPGIASSQWEPLALFGAREGLTVLKPLHLAQSRGVELLDWRDEPSRARARAALEKATEGFSRPVLLQRFLKGIEDGETRLWFLDGNLLAQVRKLPLPGDFRVNIDRGSRLVARPLRPAERKIASVIGRHLKRRGIRLAAVDLIEGYVTDFNFTSPGLLLQMERALDLNLARPIIEALAGKPADRSRRKAKRRR
ncbi:MAG: hypothetical protein NDJ89_11590 [Oligoflexia bacterium]|nr:hypothetical protein [Oligoflexia bacterium]